MTDEAEKPPNLDKFTGDEHSMSFVRSAKDDEPYKRGRERVAQGEDPDLVAREVADEVERLKHARRTV